MKLSIFKHKLNIWQSRWRIIRPRFHAHCSHLR